MQHGRTRPSLSRQCISLFSLLIFSDYSISAVSTVQTFTVITFLLENLRMLKLANFSGSVQFMWPLKSKCWTSFAGFQRKFLNKSLNVAAFSTVAMAMQKCQMCQSFLCHRLSEPRFEPSQRTKRTFSTGGSSRNDKRQLYYFNRLLEQLTERDGGWLSV